MKISTLFASSLIAGSTYAWPGMKNTARNLYKEFSKRASADPLEPDSMEMIGDLRPDFGGPGNGGPKTDIGWKIWAILTGSAPAQSTTSWQGGLSNVGSAKCNADPCCVWRHIALDMEKLFRGPSGRCTEEARASVRLGFHDAGTWSKFTSDHGGADGSIILSGMNGKEDELKRGENRGLQHISDIVVGWYKTYHQYGVGMADLIQMAATVAAVVCPLGPRVRSFVGRKDNIEPAEHNLLPDVFADGNALIELFENKTIRVHGLTALVGAHTTSQQQFVEPSRAGDPQDSTPGVWDIGFYAETLGTPSPRVFKFPSDVKLATNTFSSEEWATFANPVFGQTHWNEVRS